MISWFSKRPIEPLVRPMSAVQAGECARIHASFFARPWVETDIADMLRRPETIADAAMDSAGKTLIGFAISRVIPPEAELLTIAVAKRSRGRSVGKLLLAAHLRRISAAGGREVFLEVDETNQPAIRLYRAFGFEQVGLRPGYYPGRDGKAANALLLRCHLD